nr:MAG TPA: hypothetical protein [Caudoviricetes sp.]
MFWQLKISPLQTLLKHINCKTTSDTSLSRRTMIHYEIL